MCLYTCVCVCARVCRVRERQREQQQFDGERKLKNIQERKILQEKDVQRKKDDREESGERTWKKGGKKQGRQYYEKVTGEGSWLDRFLKITSLQLIEEFYILFAIIFWIFQILI